MNPAFTATSGAAPTPLSAVTPGAATSVVASAMLAAPGHPPPTRREDIYRNVHRSRRLALRGTCVGYATLLAPLIPDAAAHFVIASVLGAPAAILVSLIMVPETENKRTGGTLDDPTLGRGDVTHRRGYLRLVDGDSLIDD